MTTVTAKYAKCKGCGIYHREDDHREDDLKDGKCWTCGQNEQRHPKVPKPD